jgi:hypothetical protein
LHVNKKLLQHRAIIEKHLVKQPQFAIMKEGVKGSIIMPPKKNKGVFVCRGKRVHVVYNDVTLHFDFDEFEKFTFMIDDAYHRIKGNLKKGIDSDDSGSGESDSE